MNQTKKAKQSGLLKAPHQTFTDFCALKSKTQIMENQEEENLFPPFWLQTSNTYQQTNLGRRQLRRSSSLFFNSGALIVFLIVSAFVFIFIIIPTVQSFTSQIFKPQLVKKSWESLNLVLILFAVVCGFLSRNTNAENNSSSSYDSYQSNSNQLQETQKSNPTTPHQWLNQFSENGYNNKSFRRLRSSSSHPDLRQEPILINGDERWRFYDDTHVTNYRPFDSDQPQYRRPWQDGNKYEDLETETIEVDTFKVRREETDSLTQPPRAQSPPPPSQPPQSLPTPPPPPPPPPPPHLFPQAQPKVVQCKQRRTQQLITHKKETTENPERKESERKVETFQKPPPRYNYLPSTQVPIIYEEEVHHKNSAKNERNRGAAAKELLTSLKRKKKKHRQRSVEDFETILNKFYSSSSSSASEPFPSHPPPSPPPPPPPLPPPPSVFHNIFFSKKGRAKKLHSVSQAYSSNPSPPPKRSITQTVSQSKIHISKPVTEDKPTLPVKRYGHSRVANDDNSPKSGSESPLITIPPPPPPPPFKMPELKFVKYGDFVRLKSNNSSRCSSPDLDDDGDDSASDTLEGRESPSPIFCSSPDVNTKADTFIARFRAGLRLEKVDSTGKRQGCVKSNLGPRSNLGQE